MVSMLVQMDLGGKPNESFVITEKNNNNNEQYTNRNAYDYELGGGQVKRRKLSQDIALQMSTGSNEQQLDGGGHYTSREQLAVVTEGQVAPEHAYGRSGTTPLPEVTIARTVPEPGVNTASAITLPDNSFLSSPSVPDQVLPEDANRTLTKRSTVRQRRNVKLKNPVIVKRDNDWYKDYRRPANGFLIFCRIHRKIVSAYYVGKENRFITKKLGLWWSLLAEEQKLKYKKVADKRKAKYLAKFPDYRWGKTQQQLPAAVFELDLPAAVSTSGESMSSTPSEATNGGWVANREDPDDRNLEVAQCLVDMSTGVGLPPMTTFKLADESQMGSLSTLMLSGANQLNGSPLSTDTLSGYFEHNYSAAELLVNFGEGQTSGLHAEDITNIVPNNREEPCANMRQHFLAQSRPKTQQPAGAALTHTSGGTTSLASGSVPSVSSRAPRSCKGKRYQEFMIQQQLIRNLGSSPRVRKAPRKRPAATAATVTNAVVALDSDALNNNTSTLVLPVKTNAGAVDGTATIGVLDDDSVIAMDDELDDESDELPVYDLEEFLTKQKCDKRRKKPYAVSSKAARRRRAQTPKSSIPTPSTEPNAPTTSYTSLPSADVPETFVSPSPAAVVPLPTSPEPSAMPSPRQPTMPAKIVGCRKRKGLKEHIIRHPVL